jgi:hypothetical protein
MKKILLSLLLGGMTIVGAYADDKPLMDVKPKKSGFAEKVKTCKKIEGLFTLYQDTTNGSMFMVVNSTQINKEFIYFAYTENGLVETGHNRGSFRDNRIFTIKKYYDKIEFVSTNTNYYFDPSNALSKSADANVSNATLLSLKVAAMDSAKGDYLVEAGSIYLGEGLHQVKPTPMQGPFASFFFSLGSLNQGKCKYVSVRNFPNNTDVIVDLVYDNPSPSNRGGNPVSDARAVTIRLQHSLIEMPNNDFKTRRDDPRIGYFMTDADDMTSTSATPYKDVIHRWHLVKKDPAAALSEPVEPIKWWIENTTPKEFRQTIKDAALTWNVAFEKAGFKNAVQIEEQPDDATWEAGDIRYNVLRWTSSPNPPFGGYGPSFTNPRTGQILGADIMLEYIFVTNRLKQDKLFNTAGLPFLNDKSNQINPENFDQHCCSIGDMMQHNVLFGQSAMTAAGYSEVEIKDYIKQSLYYLVLHEMGHTLGLNHNMKASQMLSPDQLNNKEITDKLGLTASVMDYPAVNLTLDKSKQGLYFTNRPGPYDLWAIEYGYSTSLDDAAKEEERLSKILERSTDTLLIFGNDADDMRSPYNGIDPRVNVGDMSKDVLGYSTDRFKLVSESMKKLKEKYKKNGQSWHELRQAYLIMSGEAASAATVVSRYIGGVYINRGFIGQQGAGQPYTAVPLADQKKAMALLAKNIFAPDALQAPEDLYPYLQTQRRGFNFFGNTEDPKIHSRVLNIQLGILDQLLSFRTLSRLSDSRLYGNKYSVTEMLGDVTSAIFKDDLAGNVNTFRQNLQIGYVESLIELTEYPMYDNISKANAAMQLKAIQQMLNAPAAPGAAASSKETQAHRQYILLTIKKAFEK